MPRASMEIGIPEDDESAEPDENATLMSGRTMSKKKKKRSCLKVSLNTVITIIATCVFVVLFVQLWIAYAELINRKVFSPSIVATGKYHCETEQDYAFGAEFEFKDNNTVIFMVLPEIPPEPLVTITTVDPMNWKYEWHDDEQKLHITLEKETCTNVIVLST